MAVDSNVVPHYVLLLGEDERFAFDADKRLLPTPTDALVKFATSNGMKIPFDVRAWDGVVRDLGIDPATREEGRCFLLVNGKQSEEELQHLLELQIQTKSP